MSELDDTAIFLAFRGVGMEEETAYRVVKQIQDMAAANLIARFESKMDAQNAKMDAQNAKIDAQTESTRRELRAVRWMLGVGLGLLGVLLTVFSLLG